MVINKHLNAYLIFGLCYAPGIILLLHQQYPVWLQMSQGLALVICIGYWLPIFIYIMWNVGKFYKKHENLEKYQPSLFTWSLTSTYFFLSMQFSYRILTASYLHSQFVDFIFLFVCASIMFVVFYRLHYLSIKFVKDSA